MNLSLNSGFSYKCTQCSQCCTNKKIQTNPYEKLRLSINRGVSVTDFISEFTLDTVYLKQDEDLKCVFLGEKGCEVHLDRPLVCRLFPLGRHIFEDGTHHYSNPKWQTPPNGEYGENGTVESFVNGQGAQDFIHWADEYFKLYCLLAKHESTEFAFEIGDIDILDIESFTAFYCELNSIELPKTPNQYAVLHLKALYALIGQTYTGEMP